MKHMFTVSQALTIDTPPSSTVGVQGWVKTRRDSGKDDGRVAQWLHALSALTRRGIAEASE